VVVVLAEAAAGGIMAEGAAGITPERVMRGRVAKIGVDVAATVSDVAIMVGEVGVGAATTVLGRNGRIGPRLRLSFKNRRLPLLQLPLPRRS